MAKSRAKRRCAVCGHMGQLDVCRVWRRHRDNKLFDVCMMCAMAGTVNEYSVENHKPMPKRAQELAELEKEYQVGT